MKSTNPIAALFGRSPFQPMQEHMRLVNDCVARIPPLFDALMAGDRNAVARLQAELTAQQAHAQDIKRQIRLHLPRTLFMPVDRRDLLDLLDRQSAVAGIAQRLAVLPVQREIAVPAAMQPDLRALTQGCAAICAESLAIIDELDELIETGFSGAEAARVEQMIDALNRLNGEIETLGMSLACTLFREEDGLGPVDIMLWHQLIQWLVDLAHAAARVGDRLLLLIAR